LAFDQESQVPPAFIPVMRSEDNLLTFFDLVWFEDWIICVSLFDQKAFKSI
jgi:hypothetical protein